MTNFNLEEQTERLKGLVKWNVDIPMNNVPPQPIRALFARIESLEATIQRIQDNRSNHPKIPKCDRYTEEDTTRCGWRNAIESLDAALEDNK